MWHWHCRYSIYDTQRKCVFTPNEEIREHWIYLCWANLLDNCRCYWLTVDWLLLQHLHSHHRHNHFTLKCASVLWPYQHSTYDKLFSKCIRRCYLQLGKLVHIRRKVSELIPLYVHLIAMLDILNHFSFLPCAMHFFSYRNWIHKNSQERGTQNWTQQEFVWRVSLSTNNAFCVGREKKYVKQKFSATNCWILSVETDFTAQHCINICTKGFLSLMRASERKIALLSFV